MYRIKMVTFISLIYIVLLTGCTDQRILEDLGFSESVSYDLINEDSKKNSKIRVGISLPIVEPEAKKDREVLVTVAESSKEARQMLADRTSRILVSGQLRNSLFGIELAKQGLWRHIDTFVRDPSINQRVKVILVEGQAFKILEKEFPYRPRTDRYISDLLEKQANTQAIPEVMIYHFTRDYFDDGIDPVAPVIKLEEDYLTTDGIGLFRNDKYITKISAEKGIIFTIMKKKFNNGQITVVLKKEGDKEKELASLSSVYSKRKITVTKTKDDNRFRVNIRFTIHGSILEYIGEKMLGDEHDRLKLEKELSKFLEKETKDMFKLMQESNVDSIGLGKYVRNSMSQEEWKNMDWREVYPKIEITTNVKVKIKDYGKFK